MVVLGHVYGEVECRHMWIFALGGDTNRVLARSAGSSHVPFPVNPVHVKRWQLARGEEFPRGYSAWRTLPTFHVQAAPLAASAAEAAERDLLAEEEQTSHAKVHYRRRKKCRRTHAPRVASPGGTPRAASPGGEPCPKVALSAARARAGQAKAHEAEALAQLREVMRVGKAAVDVDKLRAARVRLSGASDSVDRAMEALMRAEREYTLYTM